MMNLDTGKETIVKRVRQFGSSTSDAVLDPASKIFSVPDIDGVLGYRTAWNCAVVFGDPVCASSEKLKLAAEFHRFCEEHHFKNIIYVAASESFSQSAIPTLCKAQIEFGEELFLDPHDDPKAREGVNASLVRRKVRHALHENCQVAEFTDQDEKLKQALERVGTEWLKTRKGLQIFTSHVRLFDDRLGKRWFYAKQNDRVVGVVLLNQLQARKGWLLNHLMITPDAPHGTPELLVTSALDALSKENCEYITFGTVPGKSLGSIVGLNKFFAWCARQFYQVTINTLRLNGHRKFWEKFHPESEQSYLLFSQPNVGLRETLALMRALNAELPTLK